MANALAASSSPYLRQHAENPVAWRPWSQAALDEAAARDVPLLISIGYSACHWCHVMAHESFEDPVVAAVMNEHFVCIKVDREERPDIDAIYMDACQALTGQGGWPLHAFATPDGRPFFAGTYYPPRPAHGLPGWAQLLQAVADAWRQRREELVEQGDRITELLGAAGDVAPADAIPPAALLDEVAEHLRYGYDSVQGGWGGAPKFPPSQTLAFLLRRGELPMVRQTLRSMASGGIFDQVGGGFARYAVDATWTVPHFEKMLYDNALLAARYAEAHAATGDAEFAQVAVRTLEWVLRDLGDADGGIASALDADSGGVEGSYYVWTPAQLQAALGAGDAAAAAAWFGVTEQGNFDDATTVLEARGERPPAEQAERIIATLAAAREQRVRPARDDKRIVSWNALAITALARAGTLLDRPDFVAAAERCAGLILDAARDGRDRLHRLIPRPGDDPAQVPAGVLDDHGHLLEALVALYEASFAPRWLQAARELAAVLLRDFADPQHGGFFTTAADHERLVARRKEFDDQPIPSGQASAALGLLRLHALTGDHALREAAERVLSVGAAVAARRPSAFPALMCALDQYHAPPREIAIVGEGAGADALLAAARAAAAPGDVLAAGRGADDAVPLLAGRGTVDGAAAAYVCERFACRRPVTDPAELTALLRATST